MVTDAGTTGLTNGSLFDIFSLATGFENLYTDVPGTGGNTITDTLVTPIGDINLPNLFDATSALSPAEYLAPGGSAAADLAAALNPADFSGLAADLSSLFDLGTLLPF